MRNIWSLLGAQFQLIYGILYTNTKIELTPGVFFSVHAQSETIARTIIVFVTKYPSSEATHSTSLRARAMHQIPALAQIVNKKKATSYAYVTQRWCTKGCYILTKQTAQALIQSVKVWTRKPGLGLNRVNGEESSWPFSRPHENNRWCDKPRLDQGGRTFMQGSVKLEPAMACCRCVCVSTWDDTRLKTLFIQLLL